MNEVEKYKVVREFFDKRKTAYILFEGSTKEGRAIFASESREEVLGVAKYYYHNVAEGSVDLFINYYSCNNITGHSEYINSKL